MDKEQFDDTDPDILRFIHMRDEAIQERKREERRKMAEQDNRNCLGCIVIIAIVILMIFSQ